MLKVFPHFLKQSGFYYGKLSLLIFNISIRNNGVEQGLGWTSV